MGRDGSGSRVVQTGRAAHGLRRPGRSTESESPSRTDRCKMVLRRSTPWTWTEPIGPRSLGKRARQHGRLTGRDRARLSLRGDQLVTPTAGSHPRARLPRYRRDGVRSGRRTEPDCGRERWVDVDRGASGIFVMDADGKNLRLLTLRPGGVPTDDRAHPGSPGVRPGQAQAQSRDIPARSDIRLFMPVWGLARRSPGGLPPPAHRPRGCSGRRRSCPSSADGPARGGR